VRHSHGKTQPKQPRGNIVLVVHGGAGTILNTKAGKKDNFGVVERDPKFGTVEAVALDKQGNPAAATSTGA